MDDRSERLRKRRKRSTGSPDEQARPDESASTEEPSESSETSESSNSTETLGTSKPSKHDDENGDGARGGSTPVKEQQTGTYMYLPESQVKRLRRQYNVLKAEYEFEYDEEFEKNRHFYPLAVRYGLERLDEMDTTEIRARLAEFYE